MIQNLLSPFLNIIVYLQALLGLFESLYEFGLHNECTLRIFTRTGRRHHVTLDSSHLIAPRVDSSCIKSRTLEPCSIRLLHHHHRRLLLRLNASTTSFSPSHVGSPNEQIGRISIIVGGSSSRVCGRVQSREFPSQDHSLFLNGNRSTRDRIRVIYSLEAFFSGVQARLEVVGSRADGSIRGSSVERHPLEHLAS